MHPLFFIGFCVLAILLLLVLLSTGKSNTADDFINKSNGTFDKAAQDALALLAEPENATELMQRGNIMRYNVLEGDANGDATRGDTRGTTNGNIDVRIAFGRVLEDYTQATEVAAVNEELMPPGFLHDIITLYDATAMNGGGGMFGGTLAGFIAGGMFGGGIGVDDEMQYIDMQLEQFHNVVEYNVPNIARNETRARVTKAVAAPTKAAAVATALAPEYRSDSQNVHDTKLNGDLNATLAKLTETGPKGSTEIDAAIVECIDYVKDKPNALAAAQKMREGTHISTYNTNEAYILAAVWRRCDHRFNVDNRELMREAVSVSLTDCTENGGLVCINGRCSRLLGSLVLLDFDSTVGSALTFDAYKNQIYEETKEMFEREIEELHKSDSADMRQLAQSYDDPSIEATDAATTEFHTLLKSQVDDLLTNYTNLNAREIEQLRRDCYVYVTI
jgi:hypothetical protein